MGVFTVTKSPGSLVVPEGPTPGGRLSLSWIDRYPTHRGLVDTLHVFDRRPPPKDGSASAAAIIRRAVSRALVLYYPLAGRLVESDSGELEVSCTGDGVLLVEAVANFGLKDVNYGELPLLIPNDDILPILPSAAAAADPLVLIQVTELACGGLMVGLRFSHSICDGVGASQFIQAIGDLARGLPRPAVDPVWRRDLIPRPPPPPTPPPPTTQQLEQSIFDIPNRCVARLRQRFFNQTGRKCSTFDIMMAKVWRCRTIAILRSSEKEEEEAAEVARLTFAASTRHLLQHEASTLQGFYGNCIFPVRVMAPPGRMAAASLFEVVGMIKEAKERLPAEFARWSRGEMAEDPYGQSGGYWSLFASDWTKLGFTEVDYGWGSPVYVGPLSVSSAIASYVLLNSPTSKDGKRLVTRCVAPRHMAAFRDAMIESLLETEEEGGGGGGALA